ncbi:TIM44-like domain-containing protein [uncultured Bosea sp.]|uniref:Tim44 domain-containing protein n=1 Tax=uncultured Bosea sp. TaxID=211457 RepID=UPI00263A94E5|nr:TIM44-like domain-containing protein [uncultured Bosea sp.]
MSLISLARRGRAVALVTGALLLVPLVAEARPGGGRSSGSRGSFTNSAPPSTNTTPGGAQTFQRSAPSSPASPSMAGPSAAGAAAAQAARPSFARNMMMGIGAGLLGAGLFGMLSGSGFFSGLASLAGMLGFVLQLALIAGIVVLAIRFFRRRSEPQLAGAGAPYARQGYDAPQPQPAASAMGGFGGGAAAAAAQPQPIELSGEDFNAFERLLGEINTAYSSEDEAGLRQRTTPEMFGYFDEDLSDNARRGVADRVSDVKLLQGDLSQAWKEGDTDYATVAMRFSLINAVYDRKSGKIVDGSATQAQEVREYWTFLRERGGAWKLSGIQQTA